LWGQANIGMTISLIRAVAAALALLALTACSQKKQSPGSLSPGLESAAIELSESGVADVVTRIEGVYVRVKTIARSRPSADRRSKAPRVVNGGSGIIVDSQGLVVTAAHIAIDTAFVAEVTTIDGVVHGAEILGVDRNRELALLKIVGPSEFVAATPIRATPGIGDPVIAIGAGQGRQGIVVVGAVAFTPWPGRISYGQYGFNRAVKLDIKVDAGFSGGPVFDRHGRLIGMIAAMVIGDPSAVPYAAPQVAYAVPAESIADYLAEWSPDRP
jgi:S1-C subfamily serine protease